MKRLRRAWRRVGQRWRRRHPQRRSRFLRPPRNPMADHPRHGERLP